MKNPIKIIDLFSGPGGLGEGFSACRNNDGSKAFEIAVSIEKEKSAHSTLLLRAFYRKLSEKQRVTYYNFMKGELGSKPTDHLYGMFPNEYESAQKEALCLELGKDNTKINAAIRESIKNEECILIGGPPCQAYSLAGRSRNMGIKNYNPKKDKRNFLYLEYLKVIARFQPVFFVMENVKGMLSAKVNGKPIFDTIYGDLKSPCKSSNTPPEKGSKRHNYKLFSLVTSNSGKEDLDRDPRDFIIRSEEYLIPQRRHRVILLGIREDLAHKWNDSLLLEKSRNKITINNILNGLPELRCGLSKVKQHNDQDWLNAVTSIKNNIIEALSKSKNNKHQKVAAEIENILKNLVVPAVGQGANFNQVADKIQTSSKHLNNWIFDKKLEGIITNNDTRGHMEQDLNRYLFCSAWAICAEREGWTVKTPKSNDYIEELVPNHVNFKTGKFADRFRVQASSIPATTITSHISKDGHYFIHPDPKQCRSLTVREAARIQTFPDNYFFVGTRTEQYVQVGNAVPPYLAMQIASKVIKLI